MSAHRTRRPSARAADKLAKVVTRKTRLGRINAAIDALDTMSPNKPVDTALHLAVEVALGKGPVDKRVAKSIRKTIKFHI